MNKICQSKRWSAALIALLLTGAMSIMMLTMLERIIPASRNTKGMENSANATFVALSWIEQSLMGININNPGKIKGWAQNVSINILNGTKTVWTGSIKETAWMIPMPGKGNSDFDKNWNKISPGKPIQIMLTPWFLISTANLNTVKLDLRVPQLWSTWSIAGDSQFTRLQWTATGTIVNLTITNANKTIVPDYKCSTVDECMGIRLSAVNLTSWIALWSRRANILENSKLDTLGREISSIISTGADSPNILWCGAGCILKLSIVNEIKNEAWNELPYLEYRIRNNAPWAEALSGCTTRYSPQNYISSCVGPMSFLVTWIPLQYAEVEWIGRIWPFEQRFSRDIQQITTGDAFDFTVIQ